MKNLFKWGLIFTLAIGTAACSDYKEETWTPEPTVFPEPEPDPDSDPDVINMQFRDTIFKYGDTFHMEIPELKSSSRAYPLGICNKVKIVNTGDNNCIVTFYSDDFDLSSLEGNTVSGMVPSPSFLGVGKEISFEMKLTPHADGTFSRGNYTEGVTKFQTEYNGITFTLTDQYKLGNDIPYLTYYYSEPENFPSSIPGNKNMIQTVPIKSNTLGYLSIPYTLEWDSSAYPEDLRETISPETFIQTLLYTPFLNEKDYGFDRVSNDPYISISSLLGRIGCVWRFDKYYYDGLLRPKLSSICNQSNKESYFPEIKHYIYPPFLGLFLSGMTDSSLMLSIDPGELFSIKIPKEFNIFGYDPYYPTPELKYYVSYNYYDSGTPAMYALLSQLLLAVSPQHVEGIKMNYTVDEAKNEFRFGFADPSLSLAFLKNLILPLLSSETNRNRLLENLKADPSTAPYIDQFTSLINNIDELFASTTQSEFGWIFSTKYTKDDMKALYEYLYPN